MAGPFHRAPRKKIMTEVPFPSLQNDMDERFLETDLKIIDYSLSGLLRREIGRSDIRETVSAFAMRILATLATVSPQVFDIEVSQSPDGVLLSGFPGGATIQIPGRDVSRYWSCLDEDVRQARSMGLDMMLLPDLFDGLPALMVPVTAARDLSDRLYEIAPDF